MSEAVAPLAGQNSGLLRRLPLIAFLVLALATVGAFLLVQEMKTAKPYLWQMPAPAPLTFDPAAASGCQTTTLRFQVQREADNVNVTVVSSSTGEVVDQVASDVPMAVMIPQNFLWKGTDAAGKTVPDGSYYFALHLIHQNHTIALNYAPVTVTDVPQTAASAGC